MVKKKAYRSTSVKNVDLDSISKSSSTDKVWVGLDISKSTVFAVLRDDSGSFQRPWKAKLPHEARQLAELLVELSKERELIIAMESTGTYGDAVRQLLTKEDLTVHLVSGKAVSDYKEVFDGVPSAHDGKDAAIIAELACFGKSRPWRVTKRTDYEAEMAANVHWLEAQQKNLQTWLGRLEAQLARHWPELTCVLTLTSGTLVRILVRYGGPEKLMLDKQSREQITKWGGSRLLPEKVELLFQSAASTIGMPMAAADVRLMQQYAGEALKARKEVQQAKRELKKLADQDEVVKRQAAVIGAAGACVLRVQVGNPLDYHCGAAYRKAMGLNLRERSSGKHQGKLKLTKRGPSGSRRWLYFATLRLIQQSPLRDWYEKKKKRKDGKGQLVVIAVMRKLSLALHAVARGAEFDLEKLFPGKSLCVSESQ